MTYRIDVDFNARISILVRAWERHQRRRTSTSTTCDRDLCARDIELGSVDIACRVQGDVLDAQEIVTGRGILGNSDANRCLVCSM